MNIARLVDIEQRPIRIVSAKLQESSFGPYLVMEDNRGRLILSGQSHIIKQYANIPTPFDIM